MHTYRAYFRKITIKGIDYFQCYDIKDDDEELEDNILSLAQSEDSKDDCFFLTYKENSVEYDIINQSWIYTYDTNYNELQLVDDKKGIELLKLFEAKYKDSETNKNDETYKLAKEMMRDVYYQDDAIKELVKSILMNRKVVDSNFKSKDKNNFLNHIVLYGEPGNGKNSILDALTDSLDVPYCDITLTGNLKEDTNNIVKSLMRTSRGKLDKLKHGVVILRHSFENFTSSEEAMIYYHRIKTGITCFVDKSDQKIDFSKLTFITTFDCAREILENDKSNFMDFLTDGLGFKKAIECHTLTKEERYNLLVKVSNNRMQLYNSIYNPFGTKITYDDDAIRFLIDVTDEFGCGISPAVEILDLIVKYRALELGDKNIHLTGADIMMGVTILADQMGLIEKKDDSNQPKRLGEGPKLKLIEGGKSMSKPETKSRTSSTSTIRNELDKSLNELVKVVKKSICSQDEQVKTILFNVLRNKRIANRTDLDNPKRYIKNILLRGESGSGKTAILSEISKILNIPIYVADATQYTENGFKGADVTDMLTNLYFAADQDIEAAQKGILVIDEIDKKASTGGDIDVSRGAVLNSLLKIVEGCVMPIEIGSGMAKQQIMFDTSRLTVICSGAFENIEEIRKNRLTRGTKKVVGFGAQEKVEEVYVDQNYNDEDYVAFGMSRQFMARLGVIVNLNKLMPEDLRKIMTESKLSELIIQQTLYKFDGIKLTYRDDFLDELAIRAFNKKIGARGIEKAFQEVLYNVHMIDIEPSKVKEVIFTKECIDDPSKLIIVERAKRKTKTK